VDWSSPLATMAWSAPAMMHTFGTDLVQYLHDRVHESDGKSLVHHLHSPSLDYLDLLSVYAYEHLV
jgi:hypothetical protein